LNAPINLFSAIAELPDRLLPKTLAAPLPSIRKKKNMPVARPKHILSLLIALSAVSICKAQSTTDTAQGNGKSKNDAFSAAKSSEDYTGKRISYPVDIMATVRGNREKKICIPANTRLRGLSKSTADGLLVTLRGDTVLPDFPWEAKPNAQCTRRGDAEELTKEDREVLVIDKADVDSLPANVSGLSYGLLVVPFKYHIKGSKDFKGSGSIGPYAGYKTESSTWGASVELVGFGGLSSVPVEDVVDGKSKTTDVSAFSYGAGVIGRIRDNFQLGVIIGADRVGKSVNYPDNGKAWIAISVGYAFSN
jgi:hypothetical protein